jgi:hypothetical protein
MVDCQKATFLFYCTIELIPHLNFSFYKYLLDHPELGSTHEGHVSCNLEKFTTHFASGINVTLGNSVFISITCSGKGYWPHNFLPKMLSYLNIVNLKLSFCHDRIFDLIWFPCHEIGFIRFRNPKPCIL